MNRIIFTYLLTLMTILAAGQKKSDVSVRQKGTVRDSLFRLRMENDRWKVDEAEQKLESDTTLQLNPPSSTDQLLMSADTISADTVRSDSAKKMVIEAPITYVAD
ncbi:MAG TPA: hypothetical protein PLW67_12995, partial [Prolixibacteraceae bacterium]|nr:hypothetical protein [Prolixibacteraceae bacterium]